MILEWCLQQHARAYAHEHAANARPPPVRHVAWVLTSCELPNCELTLQLTSCELPKRELAVWGQVLNGETYCFIWALLLFSVWACSQLLSNYCSTLPSFLFFLCRALVRILFHSTLTMVLSGYCLSNATIGERDERDLQPHLLVRLMFL